MPIRLNDPKSLEDWIVKTEQRLRDLEARRLDAAAGLTKDPATKEISARISEDPGNAASIGEDGGIKATDTVTTATDHTPLGIFKFTTASQNITNNVDNLVTWGGAGVSGNWTHDATSVTIPETGFYHITFSWQWANNATGSRGQKITLNSTNVGTGSIFSQTEPSVGIAIECAMNLTEYRGFTAGDVIRAYVFQNSGVTLGGGGIYFGDIRGRMSIVKTFDAFPPELTTADASATE